MFQVATRTAGQTFAITWSAKRRSASSFCSRVCGVALVGVAEADDRVGHAALLEAPHAVRRVGVEGDHVHLERIALAAVLPAQLGEPRRARRRGPRPGRRRRASSRRRGAPRAAARRRHGRRSGSGSGAAAPGRASRSARRRTRRGTRRSRRTTNGAPAGASAGGRVRPRMIAIISSMRRAAPLPLLAAGDEVLGPGREADAEAEAVVAQHGHRRRLLRHEHRVPDRQLHHERREAQPLRDRRRGPGSARTAR